MLRPTRIDHAFQSPSRPVAISACALSLALALLCAFAPVAEADRVVSGSTDKAVIDGQFVYFTKSEPGGYSDEGSSRLQRFDRASRLTQTIFTAPSGPHITDFGANGGVVAVLVDPDPNDDVGSAKLIQMKPDGSEQRELASVVDDGKSLPCFEYLGLTAITESGQTVMNRISYKPAAGTNCDVAVGQVAARSADPAGAITTLFDLSSPAYRTPRSGDDYAFPIYQFIFSRVLMDATDDWLIRGSPASKLLKLTNRHSGVTYKKNLGSPATAISSLYAWADGKLFTAEDSDPNRNYVTRIASKQLPTRLKRRDAMSQMRPCGQFIVELYQPLRRGKSVGRLQFALRDHRGRRVLESSKTAPRGSFIEGCEDQTVLLSYNRNNRDELAGPARTSSSAQYLFTVTL